ncbi:MAG: hypothetical protein JRF20_07035 [Deltaproteobacteria bacterium]|nr:hypothetical protein [Deltaproteobacteria bacterium]MBW1938696.1 hypothetical protein [Deltaproteobacteria bacterium]MBW1965146.1 hypothetical protein [Deltaproteobacteria bacterium]MBW2080710.1 hypothetical protein [Deltaproteobacteria bacterium]MBW2350932.1 hypothetical protein [Deltaproteobacteria bacterium]
MAINKGQRNPKVIAAYLGGESVTR